MQLLKLGGSINYGDDIDLNDAVFSEVGSIDLNRIFDNITALVQNFGHLYNEIHEYLQLVAGIHMHIAFSHFANSTSYKELDLNKPFYLFGGQYDHSPSLIYKMN